MQDYDGVSRAVEKECGPNGLVSWYMMAALTYYHFDTPVLTDGRFDEIGKTLLDRWGEVTHNYRHFIQSDLRAGTLLLPLEAYPWQVRGAATTLMKGVGQPLSREQAGRMWVPFLPPERLRDDVALYEYGSGMSWSDHKRAVDREIAQRQRASGVRLRKRPGQG